MSETSTTIFVIVISVLIFLIFRGLILWYYKIDERVSLMEKQQETLERIERLLKEKQDSIVG